MKTKNEISRLGSLHHSGSLDEYGLLVYLARSRIFFNQLPQSYHTTFIAFSRILKIFSWILKIFSRIFQSLTADRERQHQNEEGTRGEKYPSQGKPHPKKNYNN